jgi:hypothetical protein
MGTQDENNKESKSKIEQIRIDLEKKLAAIEDSKKNVNEVSQEEVLKTELKELSSKTSEVNNIIEEVEEVEASPVFEISEPIIPVKEKENKIVDIQKDTNISKEDIEDKKITDNKETKKVVSPPKTIIAAVEKESTVEDNFVTEKIEEPQVEGQDENRKSKKGILSFLIYGLLIGLFATIGYLYMDYTRENKNLEEEKMNQKLSEFKNKRYLDSIELADLNSQLEDLQSKKMLDSLDRVYEQELITNSKFKNKKAIQRNFDLASLKEATVKTNSTKSTNKANTVVDNSTTVNEGTQQNKEKPVENEVGSLGGINKDGVDVVDLNKTKDGKSESEAIKTTNSSDNIATNSNTDIVKDNNSDEVARKTESISKKKRTVKSPIYPGCEKKKTELDRKRCFTSKMYRHISRKFNTSLAQNIGLEEGIHQVRVQYIIDKAGYATVLNVRAENEKLEQEAIRVIQSLPKMTPGTIDGKRAKLQYNIPIKFAVNN